MVVLDDVPSCPVNPPMNKTNAEAVSIHYLVELLRERNGATPARIADQPKTGVSNLSNSEVLNSSMAARVDEILGVCIPAHPINNKYRDYVLRRILIGGFARADLRNSEGIVELLKDIQEKQPTFPAYVSTASIAELHSRLTKYSSVKSEDLVRFPPVHRVGHRADEVYLAVNASAAPSKKNAQDTNLSAIGKLLDGFVPDGAYFNDIRQLIVDTAIQESGLIDRWSHREAEIAHARRGSSGFVPNRFHYPMTALVKTLNEAIKRWRNELEQVGPSKPLPLESAVEIGRLIEEHQQQSATSEPREPFAKRQRLSTSQLEARPFPVPNHVPMEIRQAARRYLPPRQAPNEEANRLAGSAAACLDALIPPTRNNFQLRAGFMTLVNLNRRRLLDAADTAAINTRHRLYGTVIEDQPDKVSALAGILNDYNRAWTNDLSWRLEAARRTNQQSTADARPRPNNVAAEPFGAVNAERQSKLEFDRNTAIPHDSGRRNSVTSSQPPSSDDRRGEATESEPRKRKLADLDERPRDRLGL